MIASMTTPIRLPLLALVAALPAPLMAQSAQDFSLPPAPAPSATPQVQGPVDTESGVVPIRPRAIRTATPTPTPVPTPTPSAAAAAEPARTPEARATSTTGPAARPAPSVAASPRPTLVPRAIETAPVVAPPAQEFPPVQPTDGSDPISAPPPAPDIAQPLEPAEVATGDTDSGNWTWLAALAAALAAVAIGLIAWRRRSTNAAPPEIERPVVAPRGAAPPIAVADALTVRLAAEKLTRSAMFATLKYRLTLVNRADSALSDVSVGIDLVSAHSGAPMEEQVATPATILETRHTLARIAPRQNVAVEGEVKLPLSAAQVIMQGRHPLLVPLMRVRVDGAGDQALVKTFVVGQGQPDGGRVQPFRLDEPPRSYAPIAQRELA